MLENHHSSRNEIRMDAAEIDRLDQENELEEIVTRVRAMADVSYDMDIGGGSVSILGFRRERCCRGALDSPQGCSGACAAGS